MRTSIAIREHLDELCATKKTNNRELLLEFIAYWENELLETVKKEKELC